MTSMYHHKYGTWAIVTGASDGIGKAFAVELAKAGLSIVLVARRQELLEQLGAELTQQYGIECLILPADLSIEAEVEKIIQQTRHLDVGMLVAAAGFGTSGLFIDVPLADELSMLHVNCRAVLILTHHFSNVFRAKKRGGIVLLSSLVAFQGVPRAAHYAATKAFIQTLAEGLAVEMQPFGVDVLSVAPGPVDTGFGARAHMQIGHNAEKPQTIARGALAALGKRTTIRPGLIAKLLGYSLGIMPRFARARIMGSVMGNLTKRS